MIKHTWDISSEEKKRILSLHEIATKNLYIIKEQTEVVVGTETKKENKVFPKTKLGDKFEYGKYTSDAVKQTLSSLKPKIDEFIKNSDSSKFVVNVTAGESKVTNPSGFKKEGKLALERAKTVKKYFEELFPELIKKGILVINIPKDETEVTIGKTPYGGPGSGDFQNIEKKKKYELEQFVDFDITGEGVKTVTTTKTKFLCDTGKKESTGGFLSSDVNFTEVVPWKLNRGEGNIYLWFETFSMPDIIYFEYNGEIFGDSIFRGGKGDEFRIFVGTSLRAKFGTASLPEQMKGNKIIPLNYNDKRIINSLDNMAIWELEKSFKNTFGPDSSLSNPDWMNSFRKFDETKNKRRLISELGKDFPWGYLSSEIGWPIAKNIGPIKKVDGIDEIKIINVAPVGSTGWSLGLTCKPF